MAAAGSATEDREAILDAIENWLLGKIKEAEPLRASLNCLASRNVVFMQTIRTRRVWQFFLAALMFKLTEEMRMPDLSARASGFPILEAVLRRTRNLVYCVKTTTALMHLIRFYVGKSVWFTEANFNKHPLN